MINFSKSLHLASLAGPFAIDSGDFDCYKHSVAKAEDLAAG